MSRKNTIKRLDKLWSAKVVERDNSTCQKCGEFGDNPHHIIPRRYLAVRHDLNNGLTLCTKCHTGWAHRCILEFVEWFKAEFIDRYDAIGLIKSDIKVDLDEVEAKLKEGMC